MRLLRDGSPTFDAMCQMIDGAHKTVDLEQYIFRADEVGHRFADALIAAAGRGVTCRMLVDWVGIRGTPRSFFRRLRAAGVNVCVFNPPGWRRWFGVVPRDHRKLLVVDGARGVTGGIGIGKEWRTGVLKRRRSPWRDTAVCIEGPAGADMTRAFEHMWKRSTTNERRSSDRHITRKSHGAHLDPMTDAEVEAKFRELASRKLPQNEVEALLAALWRFDEAANADKVFEIVDIEAGRA